MFTAMKRILGALTPVFGLFLFAMLVSFSALAQEVAAVAAVVPPVVPPTQDEWTALLTSIGGLKGASSMAIAAVVIQGLMLLFRTKLGEMAGKFRLLIVSVLTLVGGIIALKISGVEGPALFMHSTTLLSFQVLLNQVMKQFFSAKGDQV
jgi:hypothetical protein